MKDVMWAAFTNEFEKIAISAGLLKSVAAKRGVDIAGLPAMKQFTANLDRPRVRGRIGGNITRYIRQASAPVQAT